LTKNQPARPWISFYQTSAKLGDLAKFLEDAGSAMACSCC